MNKEVNKQEKRQNAILELFNSSSSLSVVDIREVIQKEFGDISRVTLARDLTDLVESKHLVRRGVGPAVRYTLARCHAIVKEVDIENYFSTPQDSRSIKTDFDFSILDILREGVFTEKEYAILKLLGEEFQTNFEKIDSQTIIAKEFERILIEFSWKSSQIEGNTYSLLNTEALIKENKIAEGKTQEETQMILNQKKAFTFVLENKDEFKVLSRAKIEHVHQILTADLGITKNLRSIPVGITGTNYKPLGNVHQIEEAIDNTMSLINNKHDFFEKAFLCLVMLSYIQPFEDGNKRTARLCTNAILLAHDLVPMSYRAVDEVEYKKAKILFYETNNVSYLKTIFMQQFEFAVRNYFN